MAMIRKEATPGCPSTQRSRRRFRSASKRSLATRTGRTIAQITYDVIEAGLADAEETYQAIQARDKLRRGEEAELSAELLKEMYDLEV